MASKRSRRDIRAGEGSSSQAREAPRLPDETRLRGGQKTKYRRLKNKPVIFDKYLDLSGERAETVESICSNYALRHFLKVKRSAYLDMVCEFYATFNEARDSKRGVAIVQGVEVPVSPRIINELCGFIVPDPVHSNNNTYPDEFEMFLNEGTFSGTNVSHLLKPGVRVAAGNTMARDLSTAARTIHHIICFRLLPTKSRNKANHRHMVLLHALMTDMSINFGCILYDEIVKCASMKSKSILLPCLVTMLCTRVNLQRESHDLPYTEGPFDNRAMGQISGYDKNDTVEAEDESADDENVPVENPVPQVTDYGFDLRSHIDGQFQQQRSYMDNRFQAMEARFDAQQEFIQSQFQQQQQYMETQMQELTRRWNQAFPPANPPDDM